MAMKHYDMPRRTGRFNKAILMGLHTERGGTEDGAANLGEHRQAGAAYVGKTLWPKAIALP